MDNHHHRHNQGENVHKVVRRLEDERVGNLDGAGIAVCLDASAIIDVLVADEGAQRYGGLVAYRLEVAEAHAAECGMDAVVRGYCGDDYVSPRIVGAQWNSRQVRLLGSNRVRTASSE